MLAVVFALVTTVIIPAKVVVRIHAVAVAKVIVEVTVEEIVQEPVVDIVGMVVLADVLLLHS